MCFFFNFFFPGLVSCQPHSPCSPDRVGASQTPKNTQTVPGFLKPKRLSSEFLCGAPQKKKTTVLFCSLLILSSSLLTFWMNGAPLADVVSRLPNEVSNYEPCYFWCNTGRRIEREHSTRAGWSGGEKLGRGETGRKEFKENREKCGRDHP